MKRFIFAAALLALAVPALAAVSSKTTLGPWDLYSGTAIAKDSAGRQQRGFANQDACRNAAELLGITRTYTCRTRTTVAVTVTADPPAPVDCVLSAPVVTSTAWSPALCPSTGKQTRTVTSSRTVLTPAANGGAACPPLVVMTGEEQSCTYVPPVDPPPPAGDVVYASPPTADMSKLAPGQTLVLKPGTYTSFKPRAGTAAAWVTARAETDGTVVMPNLNIGAGNWYLRLEGLRAEGSSGSKITGSFVKVFRTGFKGGPAKGNDVSLAIGTNDRTPGASDILIEDSWVYGSGGRYKVLVYNAQRVVLRRMIARHDGGWTYDGDNPQAGFSLYDSKDVVCENCGFVDPVPGLSPFETGIYLVSNGTTSTHSTNVGLMGSFVIDSPNNGVAAEGTSAATYSVTDLLVSRGKAGAVNTNGAGHTLNVTALTANVSGVVAARWASSGSVRVTNCKIVKGTPSASASLTSCPGGAGANITNRIGVSGTMFGEPGYADLTADPLFPWPNEARIKAEFETVRPAFGGKSLTEYVQGATP